MKKIKVNRYIKILDISFSFSIPWNISKFVFFENSENV